MRESRGLDCRRWDRECSRAGAGRLIPRDQGDVLLRGPVLLRGVTRGRQGSGCLCPTECSCWAPSPFRVPEGRASGPAAASASLGSNNKGVLLCSVSAPIQDLVRIALCPSLGTVTETWVPWARPGRQPICSVPRVSSPCPWRAQSSLQNGRGPLAWS